MKVVGNCPQCGNPIWADGPEVTKRTCFCVVPIRTQPITIQIPPVYAPQPYYPNPPSYPYWTTGGTVGGNTVTYTTLSPVQPPKPPDADAGMVT